MKNRVEAAKNQLLLDMLINNNFLIGNIRVER